MENRFSRLRAPGLVVALAALMLALCALACPATAMADEAKQVAHSYDYYGRLTTYDTIDKAMEFAGEDTIVMDIDWDLGESSLDIPSGKTRTIDLNGHRITSSATTSIHVSSGATLKLTSSANYADISYRGYAKTGGDLANQTWGWQDDLKVNTGGLVTNTSGVLGQGIAVGDGSKLQVENAAVAGCPCNGICINGASTVDLTNAVVCHNSAGSAPDSNFGGGVYFSSYGITLNMTNSHIDDNYAKNNGGGVYVITESTINMEKGSTISRNAAGDGGGGIYCNANDFTIKSGDGTGKIEDNASLSESGAGFNKNKSGGGIHVNSEAGTNKGLIEGVTIEGNYAGYDGGGVELDMESTRLVNCKIIGNSARLDGGGVFVYNDYNSIEGCEIRENWCGGGYEGGGVFVSYHYDIKMSGVCVVKDNARGGKDSGVSDDVFLGTLSGGGGKAYITGTLESGSSVGVRTGIEGDRRIAKNFKPETKDCLFYDMSGYYVSYGTDEGGDAWQRHTTKEFTVQLDGKTFGKYRNGTAVAVTAPATKDGKSFWRWDSKYTTGLNPLSDYFPGNGAFSNAVAFTMPQNDVELSSLYVDKVTSAQFVIEAPEAGKALSATGQLVRTDGGASGSATVPCSVYWYEVGEDGKASDTSAVGVAKANTTYKAYVTAPESAAYGVFYSDSITEKDVTVLMVTSSGKTESEPLNAYVTLSNSLAANTAACTTGAGTGRESKTGSIDVQLKDKGLVSDGEASVAALALDDRGDAQVGLGDSVQISFTYDDESDTVTIAAPAREGYNFCNWDGVPAGIEADDEAGTVTAPASELESIESLTAAYAPVATALEVELDAPVAGGELASTCADIEATCSDGQTVSLAEGFGADFFEVSWSPEADGNKAGYSTAYTALIKLCEDDGYEDVEEALAAAAKVTCNGVEATSAGFTVKDGELCLAVTFPATAVAKTTSVSQPNDIELTFEQAKACAELGIWPLAGSVDVAVESGVAVEGDVEWQAVEGFDADATGAQELTAHGVVARIAVADGSEIDDSGLSREVVCKIKVAAPSQDGGSVAADASGSSPDNGGKSALAKTGDSIPTFAEAAVGAFAAMAIAAAAVAARRRRG